MVTAVGEGVDEVRAGRPRLRRRLLALRRLRGLRLRPLQPLPPQRLDRPLLRRRLRAAGPLPRLLRGAAARRRQPTRSAALLEPLAVGLHALDRGGARAGERLVVVGYGPIGACTALVATGARTRGAGAASATRGGGRGPRPRASRPTTRPASAREVRESGREGSSAVAAPRSSSTAPARCRRWKRRWR